MISLGRDLIASMNGKEYPVKRSYGGVYLGGTFYSLQQNQTVLVADMSLPAMQAAINRLPGMEDVVVAGDMVTGFSINFATVGARDLVEVFGKDLMGAGGGDVDVIVARLVEGDVVTPEIQFVSFSVEPDLGSVVLMFGEVVPVTCFASVQPLSGAEILRLAEGDRDTERWKAYSADRLYISDETKTGRQADIVTVDGVDYQVESVQRWTDFYKCVLVEIEPVAI